MTINPDTGLPYTTWTSLGAAGALTGAEIAAVVQNGVSVRTTTQAIANLTNYDASFIILNTVAALQAATVPTAVTTIQLLGYYAVNDGGGSVLAKSTIASYQFQSADGAYWHIIYLNGYDIRQFGASTALSDNGPFINSCLAALPSNKGRALVGPGNFLYSTAITCTGKFGVYIIGNGGVGPGAATSSLLSFTGTGSGTAIDMAGSYGTWITDLYMLYTNSGFTGTLVSPGAPATQNAHSGMERITIAGTPHTANKLIDLSYAQNFTLRNFAISGASGMGAVVGPASGAFATVIKIMDGEFNNCVVPPLANAADSWNIDSVIFEALTDGTAGAYRETGSHTTARALSFTNGCWFGDVTVDGGTWISTAATSFTLRDSLMGAQSATPGASIGVSLSAAKGADIRGNTFTFIGTVVSLGGTCTNISYGGNEESSCGTIIANPANAFPAPTGAVTGNAPPATSTTGTDTTPSVTETYICQLQIPTASSVTGVALLNGSAVAGNIQLFVANATGTVVAATASTAASGTAAYQRVPLTAVTYFPAGIYFVCLQCSNTGMRFRAQPFGNFGASKKTGTVYGTLATVTPPTTFTADLGPIAGLY